MNISPLVGSLVAVVLFLLGGAAGNLVWKGEITSSLKSTTDAVLDLKAELRTIPVRVSVLETEMGTVKRHLGIGKFGTMTGEPLVVEGGHKK